MKLLFVTPYFPGPPIFGGQRRIHGLMTQLAREHEVSVVAMTNPAEDHPDSLSDTQRYCRHVIAVPDEWHRIAGRKKRILQLATLLAPLSWERVLYQRPAFQAALDEHLATHRYDVITCEFAFMGSFALRRRGSASRTARTVLDEHNVEYDVLRRTASAATLDRRVFNGINWRKLRREEVAAWKRFDGVALTSRRDERVLLSEVPRARTTVVPNGVDVEEFRPAGVTANPSTLLFFGAMNYYPNTDGAVFFVREVLPLVRERVPEIELRIVGPVGPGPVMDLASDHVKVVGFVEDLRAEIDRAGVVVAPLRIGGGTRLKILEAMSMARPIVSTRLGAEGIDVAHDRDILLGDTPRELADHVVRLVRDGEARARLGAAARRTAEDHYSWHASAERMTAFYESLLALPARR